MRMVTFTVNNGSQRNLSVSAKQVQNFDLNTMFKCTVNLYQLDKNIFH